MSREKFSLIITVSHYHCQSYFISIEFEVLDLTSGNSTVIARNVYARLIQSLWAVQVLFPNCIFVEI